MTEIRIVQNILKANEELAAQVRRRLAEAGVIALNLIGSPGAGKTALLETTVPALKDLISIGVIEADCATARDAERIETLGIAVSQVNTGKGCHIPAHLVLRALDTLEIERFDLLFIENVGNLVCPAELDIGETAKIAVISTTEGDDKPQKYPMLFRQAAAVVLNKIDLVPYTPFCRDRFDDDLRAINADVPLFALSCTTGEGVEDWSGWLKRYVSASRNGPTTP